MDGWLSWSCWLTDSGRLNHKVVSSSNDWATNICSVEAWQVHQGDVAMVTPLRSLGPIIKLHNNRIKTRKC